MLKKLLKHEWKSVSKIPALLLLVLFAVTIMAGMTFAYPFWNDESIEGIGFLVIMIWMLFYAVLIGVSVGITIYLAAHFYKTMYTDEGYLTHTLPVTARQLLLSKLLPMTGWTYIASIAVTVSVIAFAGMGILLGRPEGVSLAEFIASMSEEIKLVFAELKDMSSVGFLCSMLLTMLVSGISAPMMIIGSVTIGQMVSKHKILGAIGAYFALNMIMNFLGVFGMIPTMIQVVPAEAVNVLDVLTTIYFIISIIMLIVSIVLFIISEVILRKKLNLD